MFFGRRQPCLEHLWRCKDSYLTRQTTKEVSLPLKVITRQATHESVEINIFSIHLERGHYMSFPKTLQRQIFYLVFVHPILNTRLKLLYLDTFKFFQKGYIGLLNDITSSIRAIR